jgi:hypothetical protein
MHRFQINQYTARSDLSLPCGAALEGNQAPERSQQIRIVREPRPLDEFPWVSWIGKRAGSALRSYDVGHGVLVCLDNCVQLGVEATGRRVTAVFDATDDQATAYACALVVNLGMSICTLFHGHLPLHGASVQIESSRIGILARSGSGKSTLLWALLDRGARFANDDVVPVWVEDGRLVAATSGGLHAKLSRQALEERGLDPAHYAAVLPDGREFWVPMPPEQRAHETRPLDALFVLQPSYRPDLRGAITVRRMVAGAAVGLLMANTQGLWAVYPLLDGPKMLALYRAVLENVPIYVLEYYKCWEALPELVRIIREVSAGTAQAGRARAPNKARRAPRRFGLPRLPGLLPRRGATGLR